MRRAGPSLFAAFAAAFVIAMSLREAMRDKPTRLRNLDISPLGTPAARMSAQPARNVVRNPRVDLGHGAESPQDIPARGWLAILKRTVFKFSDNELMSEAASVTFYALLAIFPAIAALISLYGLFTDPKTISDHLDSIAGFMPSGGMDIIKEQVQRLTQNPAGSLGFGAIIGLGTALWSANQGSKAMFSALNDVYAEKEKRSFVKLTAITLGFTSGALVFLLIVLGAVVVIPIVLSFLGLNGSTDLLVRLGRWPIMLVIIAGFLAALYRIGPSRQPARWRWLSWGSVFAALAWVGLSIGFSWYVTHFGSYNKTYGSLGAVVGFMTWIWLSTTVILLGAQLNAEMELQTAQDTTTGPPLPMGARGAERADKVAQPAL